MSTRQRSATASRKDAYGLWRPSDSDSDRPRQTMAATQRHNEDKHATADGSRKHRSSRRTDPVDPTASHSHHHKSSSRDRTSTALPSSYPSVPQSPAPSAQYRAQDAYSDAYGLRAYIKRRADKRSPRSSNERVPGGDDPQTSRSAYPSRHDYATTASYAQPPAAANYYAATSDQTTRDPTSSSRRHRERDKDREKSSRRDAEKASTRSRTVETPEERERRKRKEKEVRKEKEKSSKDRERRREKERSGDQEARTAGDLRQPDVASVHQGYGKGPVPAERSTERLPAGYPDYGRTPVPQATSVQPSAPPTAPWNGLTAGGRVIPQLSTPVVDAGYPSASDREDPPLPIPPPGSRRERSSSKARHSQRHQMLAQQAGQDSGISSSEQEHSVMERARRYISREQASTLGRGQSSGPSGSENEKAPTLQKERRKHKTRGESSRHRSRTAATDPQEPPGPSTSQEIAAAWYQRHQRDASATKPSVLPGESSQHPPTAAPYNPGPTQSGAPYTGKPTSHVGLTTSQRPAPQIVSIRAGQGPPEPHAGTLLPKTHSSTSIARQADPQPTDRAQDAATRLPTATQYNQQTAARQLEALLQSTPGQPHHLTHADTSRTYQHASAVSGTAGAYQQPVYPSATSSSQHVQSNAVAATVGHGGQQVVLPDVVIRPPSAAPTQHDPYSSRATAGVPPTSFQQGGRLQPNDPRSRSTPAPQQNAGHTQMTPATSNQVSYPQPHATTLHLDVDLHRSAPGTFQQYNGSADLHRIASPAPHGSGHTKGVSQDIPARFPVYEDTLVYPQPASTAPGYGSQHTGVAYNPLPVASNSRNVSAASQGYPSASPKRGMTYPGASAPPPTHAVHVNPTNHHAAVGPDPRSPKPPSVATITPEAPGTRSRTQSGNAREQSGQNSLHQPSPRHEQQGAQLAGDNGYAYGVGTGHSPSRQHLADPGRSPAVGHAVSAGSAGTPKHSPSGRLHSHRNGSNDTIPHSAPTKPSPSSTIHQQLPHYTSATTVQSHAASRPDNPSLSRQPNASSGYPELARYRSPAPVGYPTAQLPSTVPNGAATGHSQSYSTQTPYDHQYGRSTATHPQITTSQYPQPVSQAQARSTQANEYGHRAQDPPHSAPPTTTSMPITGQRVPLRSAPSPAPTVRPTRLHAVSSPSGKTPAPLQSAPPQPVRNQTYPTPAPSQYATQHPPAHSRTASDPQYASRAVNAAYATGSLPSRHQMPPRTTSSSTMQQQEVLLTPSSLAPSMLPQVTPTVPLGRTTSKTSTIGKDKDSKKKGFFGLSLFRSRSSPPKQREVEPPPSAAIREKRTRNISHPSPHPPPNFQAPQVSVKPQAGAPAPQVAVAAVSIPAPPQPQRGPSSNQVPIAAPTPVPASGRRSPNGKIFTPFRLLSRRHRTVSAASVEAVDGTVINAMLTGNSSTRSSTAGRPSPPLRDPLTAAHEWRNKEENEQQGRGTVRRRRPGVTFDIEEEVPEDGRAPVQKSLRANIAAMQSASGPVPAHRQATA